MSELQNQIRQAIYEQLKSIDKEMCPNVYERIQTKAGYAQVESEIIGMMAHDFITPGACVAQLESEMA